MAEFILKDWYGNNCTFDKDKIFVQDVNGELVEFTQGKGNPTLETLEVTENGTYTPSEGVDGFNNVVVEVPTPEITLQDKTITENGTYTADEGFDGLGSVLVNIASSGGSNVKIASGTINTEQNADFTIDHNLGVVPDFVYVKNKSLSADHIYMAMGVSSAFANKIDPAVIYNLQAYYASGKYYFLSNLYGIDTSYGRAILNATETNVTIKSDAGTKVSAGSTWVAIGGLTE